MQYTRELRWLAIVRRVEREARARGHHGDVLADEVPLVGTFAQQMQIAALGCDSSPGPMSTRDRELHGRLVRAAVLTSPPDEPVQQPARPARRRIV